MEMNDRWFCEWEAETFGCGYGTGEEHIIPIVRRFVVDICELKGNEVFSYDYRKAEEAFGAPAAWFLINALGQVNTIEWGTSARFGWLTTAGRNLRAYMAGKTTDELIAVVTESDQPFIPHTPDRVNLFME